MSTGMMMHRFDSRHPRMAEVIDEVKRVIIGKHEVIELTLVAILAGGHVLLEDVPGVGKTKLVQTLAKVLGCNFKRIQFTPDMLPSDVTGVSIYHPQKSTFEFREGPIFGQIILADEINRTTPKTQAALLEALEEGHVTVDGITRALPRPFVVLATQNPIEYEGTFPLPEAQLDRFLLKLSMGYPTVEEEIEILGLGSKKKPLADVSAVLSAEELLGYQEEVAAIHVDTTLKRYIVEICQATRKHPLVYLGISPRGSIALLQAAQALAFLRGRDYLIPDDVKYLAPYVLEHRLLLHPEARLKGITAEMVVEEILQKVAVPLFQEVADR